MSGWGIAIVRSHREWFLGAPAISSRTIVVVCKEDLTLRLVRSGSLIGFQFMRIAEMEPASFTAWTA